MMLRSTGRDEVETCMKLECLAPAVSDPTPT